MKMYLTNFAICLGVSFSINCFANNVSTEYCSGTELEQLKHGKLQLISDNFKFLEGPTWSSAKQVFYFSEMDFSRDEGKGPYANIYQLTLPKHTTLFKEDSGSNGLLALKNKLIVMDHGNRQVSVQYDNKTEYQTLANGYKSALFNSPNDATMSSSGTIYFTDPDWQLNSRETELGFTGVYSLNNDGLLTLIDKTLNKPNGIALSNDERWLYVGDYSHHIYRYEIGKYGEVGQKETFISINTPDGMAVDCAGNLYIAAHTEGKIVIYDKDGNQLTSINIGHKVTNMAFGGKELKTLLITTSEGLYSLTVNVPGKALF